MLRNSCRFAIFVWIIKILLVRSSQNLIETEISLSKNQAGQSRPTLFSSCNQTDIEAELEKHDVNYEKTTIVSCVESKAAKNDLTCQVGCMHSLRLRFYTHF